MTDQVELKLSASQLFAEIRNDLPTSVEAPLGGMLDQLQRQIHALEDNIATGGQDSLRDPGTPTPFEYLQQQVNDLNAWRAVVEKDLSRLRGIVDKLAERLVELWKWYDRSLHRVAETELDNQRHRKDGLLSDLTRCMTEIRGCRGGAFPPSAHTMDRWGNTLEVVVSRLGDML